MTCDVQALRDEAACLTCSAGPRELLAMAVIAACNAVNATPMNCDVQSLKDSARCFTCSVSDRELLAMLVRLLCALANSGGSGGICVEGENYCFSGLCPDQVFKVKNLDTTQANRVDTINPDGTQTWQISDGSSC